MRTGSEERSGGGAASDADALAARSPRARAAVTAAAHPEWTWPALHEGQRAVLLDLVVHGARSRAELARRAGLSRTSLTRLINDLEGFGFVEESDIAPPRGRGRPAGALHVVPSAAHFVGVKLTGDALYAVVIDMQARIVAEREAWLPSRAVEQVVDLIAETTADLVRDTPRVAALGVCLAGDVLIGRDRRARVAGSPFLGWGDVPLQSLVETSVGLPVAVSNDVQALTMGHHWFGAGAGLSSIAVVGYGEGIGAGIVVNDELVHGSHGRPGRVGHIAVGLGLERCDAGHVGCVSALAPVPRILAASGQPTLEAVLRADAEGDRRSARALDGAAEALGAVAADLTNLVDPQLIVLTGEGLPVARAREARLRTAIAARLDPASDAAPIALADFRFEDYARGAAACALRSLVI